MPFFHRKSHEEREREDEAKARMDASLQALEQGGIPPSAQERLARLKADGGLFTSDLSVNEFLLARQTGMEPITQVMGSCTYHVGWQNMNWSNMSGELEVVSQAFTKARRLAIQRLREEAERAGAHVVAGVRLHFTRPDFGDRLIEFQAFGTAMRLQDPPDGKYVAVTNLSGQDFWKLYANGLWPYGVATGSTVFHAVNTWRQQMGTGFFGGWRNQEMQDFTANLYRARNIALNRVQQEGISHTRAIGLVGVTLDQEEEEIEIDLGNDNKRTDMIFTFHVIGTCVGELQSDARTPIHTAVDLRA